MTSFYITTHCYVSYDSLVPRDLVFLERLARDPFARALRVYVCCVSAGQADVVGIFEERVCLTNVLLVSIEETTETWYNSRPYCFFVNSPILRPLSHRCLCI
jgi:hypothetical protein